MRVFRFTSAFLAGVTLTASPAFTQDVPPAGASYVEAEHIGAEPLGKGRFLLSPTRSFSNSF